MCIRAVKDGILLEVKVKSNSQRFGFRGGMVIEVTSPPREGKANLEIVKGLSRLFGRDVEILRGKRSRDKVILVRGASPEEIKNKLGISR